MHEDYDTQVRRSAFLSKEALRSTKLPILNGKGQAIIPNAHNLNLKKDRDDTPIKDENASHKRLKGGKYNRIDKHKQAKSSSNMEWKKLNTIQAQKNYLSQISQTILSDPNKNLILLDFLFDLYEYSRKAQNSHKELPRLTLVSTASIIIDLTPSYSLIDDKISGNTTQSSKSTIAIRNYESSLLQYTLRLIEILNKLHNKSPQLAIPIICRLITTGNETSCSEQLIKLCLWSFSHLYESQPNLAKLCSECLRNFIYSDPTLRSTLRVVKLISQVDKDLRKNQESPRKHFFGSILSIFSQLGTKITKIWNQHRDLTPQSKRIKNDKELIKDLRTSSLFDTYETTKQHESEILQELLILYLRILNNCSSYQDEALNVCLRGIGSISVLVNTSLTDEIIESIKNLLNSGRKFHPIVQIGGIETILNVLKSSHGEIKVEISWLSDMLYNAFVTALPYLSANCSKTAETNLAGSTPVNMLRDVDWNNLESHFFHCLDDYIKYNLSSSNHSDSITNYSKMVNLIKKLLEVSLHTEFHLSTTICKQIGNFLSKYPRISSSLQFESFIDNKVLSQTSVIPETFLLIHHIYPNVKHHIISILEKSQGDYASEILKTLKSNGSQKYDIFDKSENPTNLNTNLDSESFHDLGEEMLRNLWPKASNQALEKFHLQGSILKPKSLTSFRSTCTDPQKLMAWKENSKTNAL